MTVAVAVSVAVAVTVSVSVSVTVAVSVDCACYEGSCQSETHKKRQAESLESGDLDDTGFSWLTIRPIEGKILCFEAGRCILIDLNNVVSSRRFGWGLLGLGIFMLFFLSWSPGLWDPWEMNRAHVAKRIMEKPLVLTVGDQKFSDEIEKTLKDRARVQKKVVAGSAISTAQSAMYNRLFQMVFIQQSVVNPKFEHKVSNPGRKAALTITQIMPTNMTTRIVFVGPDANLFLRTVRDSIGGLTAEKALNTHNLSLFDDNCMSAANIQAATGLLSKSHTLLAQFKKKSETRLMPLLEPLVTGIAFGVMGMNEFAARFGGSMWGLLILLLLYFYTRRTFGDRRANFVLMVLITSPLFYLQARFTASEMSMVLWTEVTALATIELSRSRSIAAAFVLIPAAMIMAFLAEGLTGALIIGLIPITYTIIMSDTSKAALGVSGLAAALFGLLAVLTFLPDSVVFRQFRFTAQTFAGGMRSYERTFDFALKETGYGLFPWSALLPLSFGSVMARAFVGHEDRERVVILLWALVPLSVIMVTLRPFNHYLVPAAPAFALVTAFYLDDPEADPQHRKLLAFFSLVFFVIMVKGLLSSPASLVSYLTTDPQFAKKQGGPLSFPPDIQLGAHIKYLLILNIIALFTYGGRILTWIGDFARYLDKGKRFRNLMLILGVLTLIDIGIFFALKWQVLTMPSSTSGVQKSAVLMGILLTGPDIAAFYAVILFVVALRYRAALAHLIGHANALARIGKGILVMETRSFTIMFISFVALLLTFEILFAVFPALSRDLSQKHVIEAYKISAKKSPGKLYKYGHFAASDEEDFNFYTATLPNISSLSGVVTKLSDASKRTFVIVPKKDFSRVNYDFRKKNKDRFLPVLDDSSWRFVLLANRLVDGEKDHNWLKKAVFTQKKFDKLPGLVREKVNFENKIEFLGYWMAEKAVTRGTNVEIRMYFKCQASMSRNWRIFMHVDKIGSSSRIHGEHFVLNLVQEKEDTKTCVGCFSTAHWMPGDIVQDSYRISIPIGSPSGAYNIWFGFYLPSGAKRLKVKNYDKGKITNDGSDRVKIGILTVK